MLDFLFNKVAGLQSYLAAIHQHFCFYRIISREFFLRFYVLGAFRTLKQLWCRFFAKTVAHFFEKSSIMAYYIYM